MPQLRYNVATSLDGYIASLDGSTEWIIEDNSIDFGKLYAEFDYFVMGRKTYEIMQCFGGSDNPLAKQPKESVIVASRTMEQRDFPNITIIKENVIDYVRRLKSSEGGDIWLMGGGKLAAQCLEAGLVDTIEAAVMPVLLGNGIKMIEPISDNMRLSLSGTQSLESGILMTRYVVSNREGQ
ncbi:riboflavin biosynthesis domain-containing [Fusarium longipes]|uniref:2,5-diamino-6-ribosylamino-4(3H)-pyrimidinone 5'-phosphate reductase n=1 Tax=Fusarium longipes TaxID=694270 RepID=A0A395T9Q7_9HYPO|nr:riboflavin biosynthesis domain-containing [Fusarium longipes]